MRPISTSAYVLFGLFEGLPYIILLGGAAAALRLSADFTGVNPLFMLPVALLFASGVFYVLRGIRQKIYLTLATCMARTPLQSVREAGVFLLLRVAYRYRALEMIDYVGMQSLHRAYDKGSARTQARLHAILVRMAQSVGAGVAPAAHDFLDEVAPERQRS